MTAPEADLTSTRNGLDRHPAHNLWSDAVICLQIQMGVSKKPHRQAKAVGQLLSLARTQPILRTRDLAHQGIHTSTLTRMTRAGALERVGPGRYRLPKHTRSTEHHDLVVAAAAVPRAVVC